MKPVYSLVSFIGVISMYLFACHGFLRSPFLNLANYFGSSISSLLISVIFITFAIGVAYMLMILEKLLREWFRQQHADNWRYGRFLLISGVILVGFGFLLIKANAMIESESNPKKEVIGFSATNTFEDPGKPLPERYSDSVFFQGERSFRMAPPETFSPDLQVDLSRVNLEGVYEADASVMLFTTDSLSSGNLVFEIHDIPTGKRLEWQSTYLAPGKFNLGKWFLCTFTYPLSKGYLAPTYKIKVYLWTTGKGIYYADELKLELKARR
jgi:hypothetical protein